MQRCSFGYWPVEMQHSGAAASQRKQASARTGAFAAAVSEHHLPAHARAPEQFPVLVPFLWSCRCCGVWSSVHFTNGLSRSAPVPAKKPGRFGSILF